MSICSLKCIKKFANNSSNFLERYLSHLLLLAIRIFMAKIFFYSGLTKIKDFESTIFLFEYEYQVPFLAPKIAAFLATGAELILPVLLVFGLFGRLASFGLLCMALVIQFLLPTEYNNFEHYYWMLLLGVILVFGCGKISLDRFLKIG